MILLQLPLNLGNICFLIRRILTTWNIYIRCLELKKKKANPRLQEGRDFGALVIQDIQVHYSNWDSENAAEG
jgi:hypothetical protein